MAGNSGRCSGLSVPSCAAGHGLGGLMLLACVSASALSSPLVFGCGHVATPTQDAGTDVDGGEIDGGAIDGGPQPTNVCPPSDAPVSPSAWPLRLNEVMSDNDGAAIDELGETDDFIELYNAGVVALELRDYRVRDQSGAFMRLPARTLAAGEHVLLWADSSFAQGPLHLPFSIDADGERIELLRADSCEVVDRVELPALPLSESYARQPDGEGAFALCRYATPGRLNGESCGAPPPPELPDDVRFASYAWPSPWPPVVGPLLMTELSLRPADFIEVKNVSDAEVALADFTLELAATEPGLALPALGEGTALGWPVATLAPGARVVVPVPTAATAALDADPLFEGVATLFDADGETLDRRDFMHWPDAAVLARPNDDDRPIYCENATPGAATERCEQVQSRDVGDRVRALQTPADFQALAAGGVEVGQRAVKVVVDMQASDTVHLLGAERWPLHYTFVRETIDHLPELDRCDPIEAAEFNTGWNAFSSVAYTSASTRRYLVGTLVEYANGLHTLEFFVGDPITATQMKRAFVAAMARVEDPTQWSVRPTTATQVERLREVEGQLPIVGPNAPFVGVDYQPLTQTVGYGELRFVPSSELATTELGPRVIVITDDVPNDIALVGGLVTEAFQTPLAHDNVLSESRGTPNMALRGAHDDERLRPLMGKLVRLEVGPLAPIVREATPEEADEFYRSREPQGPKIMPPSDASVRGVVPLQDRGLRDLPAIGAKAAQFAELYQVNTLRPEQGCPAGTLPLDVPRDAFAVPVAHYLDHFVESGARAMLQALLDDPAFRTDSSAHESGLAAVRAAMLEHPVDPELLSMVDAAVETRFGSERLRFRSSSNTKDLPEFNGAGLHTSVSVERGDPDLSIEDGLRIVWASLWNTRAFDERELGHLDQLSATMAVLVHLAHRGEAAQGVAISRNLLDPMRVDIYYLNAQRGEASVTNPAPGVATEQLLYTLPPRAPLVEYQSMSSLTAAAPVLTFEQIQRLGCALGAIDQHFRPLLDPDQQNHLFAMQIEWKLTRENTLVVKQARPMPFKTVDLPADCREF